MKAVQVHQVGGIDALQLDDIGRPTPGRGEVLVRVRAAGVGPWDVLIRTGTSELNIPLPVTPGSDIAGVVESVGADVTDVTPGMDIYGLTNPLFIGGYAEFAVATAGTIARKPQRLTYVEAAAVPVVAVTAWRMVFDHARVAPGQTILVHGGAGAVGAYAVQLAHRAKARVIATASAADFSYVRSLGADQLIDFHTSRFEDASGKVDAVIDTVGGDVQRRSMAIVSPGGILVSAVAPPDAAAAAHHQIRAVFFIIDVTKQDLVRVGDMIDAGELSVDVGTILPLAEARLAHEYLAGRKPRRRGKIVLRVD